MKIIQLKKQIIPALHLAFWFVSFNFWSAILNPGVESTGTIDGIQVGWDFILLANSVFLLYCSLPFIWLIRKARLWIKIPISILFLFPLGYVILQYFYPNGNKDDVAVFMEYFVKNFLYVVVFHLSIIGAVYFNLNFLLVRYLNRSKFTKYVLGIVILLPVAAIANYSIFNFVIDKLYPSLYYISYFKFWELILIFKVYLIVSILVFLVKQYVDMLIEKRDAARNELSALKAQINPHFLFNNLNTIYSMASQKDERTADVVLKLSDFLRYVLYDTSSETIPLEKEIEIIRTYIELQKERINSKITTVEFETEGNFTNAQIAPLLLLPLAENCFKHGIGKNTSTIRINISYDGAKLTFSTENQVAPRERTDTEKTGGLGIQNVEKRLTLIYPDRHSLEIQEKDGIFRLEMKVQINA
ncbi:two-component system sensor protein, no kinase domain [Aquipluma nitroreducens]|uniref:Two-component system sensor protein, no kinase domain n=1 Tax=Aquipluma nitroreducens TaxID=2010828 RepID=A0A5K7SAT0_9BACT|nr:sensor histidine kinase [Aquipluma nitroreducens]BBE18688.1 two-component system sensor protein, no kinase domain [Aquipluma nitroreducens]